MGRSIRVCLFLHVIYSPFLYLQADLSVISTANCSRKEVVDMHCRSPESWGFVLISSRSRVYIHSPETYLNCYLFPKHPTQISPVVFFPDPPTALLFPLASPVIKHQTCRHCIRLTNVYAELRHIYSHTSSSHENKLRNPKWHSFKALRLLHYFRLLLHWLL